MNVQSEPTMIMPGDIGQVFHAFEGAVTIRGFSADDEAVITQIIAGKGTHTPEAPSKSVEGLNLPLPPGSFAIALVRNTASHPRAVQGTWTVDGDGKAKDPDAALTSQFKPEFVVAGAPAASPGAVPASSPAPTGPDPWQVPENASTAGPALPAMTPAVQQVPNPPPPPSPVHVVGPQGGAVLDAAATCPYLHSATRAKCTFPPNHPGLHSFEIPASVSSASVGANEVAIVLTLGEAMRLADIVAEGRALEQGERWSIVRKLRAAVGK